MSLIILFLPLFQLNVSADFESPKQSHKGIGKEVHSRFFFLLICMKVLTLHKSYNDFMKTCILKSKICKMISK